MSKSIKGIIFFFCLALGFIVALPSAQARSAGYIYPAVYSVNSSPSQTFVKGINYALFRVKSAQRPKILVHLCPNGLSGTRYGCRKSSYSKVVQEAEKAPCSLQRRAVGKCYKNAWYVNYMYLSGPPSSRVYGYVSVSKKGFSAFKRPFVSFESKKGWQKSTLKIRQPWD